MTAATYLLRFYDPYVSSMRNACEYTKAVTSAAGYSIEVLFILEACQRIESSPHRVDFASYDNHDLENESSPMREHLIAF